PWLQKIGLSKFPVQEIEMRWFHHLSRRELVIMATLLLISLVLSFRMPLTQTWYVYGIIVLFCASWYGLKTAIFVNTWVSFITLGLPMILGNPWPRDFTAIQTPATLVTL